MTRGFIINEYHLKNNVTKFVVNYYFFKCQYYFRFTINSFLIISCIIFLFFKIYCPIQ